MVALFTDGVPDILDFDCPRCKAPASERMYGPCSDCIEQLRETQGLGQKEVLVEDYVPKMNVVPNAIASKE
jgi:hypothetical protein